ncbi:EB module [Ancylostoma ceylanicum]|uniref:EB module n=1 Tax=Ancylostoma ceylanicum TaxID=53326 RepID=A0A0D6LUN4_9BILA|nr:EB module [Ancylostoma ceylanicum]
MINNRCVTYSIVGGPCMANAQCVGGAVCQNSYCACEAGSTDGAGGFTCSQSKNLKAKVMVNGKCTPKVPVGYPCQISQQCLGGAQCNYGTCQCPAGQAIVNGVCSGGSGGGCLPNQVMVNGQCMPTVVIGSRCSFTQQCLGNSVCINNFCQCPSGSTQFNGKCSSPECRQNQVSTSSSGPCSPQKAYDHVHENLLPFTVHHTGTIGRT